MGDGSSQKEQALFPLQLTDFSVRVPQQRFNFSVVETLCFQSLTSGGCYVMIYMDVNSLD